jgi:hypothetical protein
MNKTLLEHWIEGIIDSLKISMAKHEARRKHKAHGKRYWVLLNQGKYIVVSRADIKGSHTNISKLLDHAIYVIG